MGSNIFEEVKDLLVQKNSPDYIKQVLVRKGYLESDVDDAIESASSDLRLERHSAKKSVSRKFALKEILDRIGYGFVSHPFLNILFSFTGASYFLIGLINGLRTIFSLIYSSFLKEFSKVHDISKSFISRSGVLFGFSFLILSFAVVLRSPLLYSIAFLGGSLGVVAHGEIYSSFLRKSLKREHMGGFLSWVMSYGILITVISMLLSGYIIDLFPLTGQQISFTLFGKFFEWQIYGYLIAFEFTAFAFILSGLVLSRIKQHTIENQRSLGSFVGEFMTKTRIHSKFFLNNKVIVLLTLSTIITGLVQVLGNSFYGIYIYEEFKNQLLGGFLNVAVIFSIAVVFSFIGPWFTKRLRHHIGISPMLVFGTLLSAMLPLSLAYNPNLMVVGVATALSIIGASILGMAQGFFTHKLLTESERDIYFSFVGVAVSLPMLILVPIGAYVAHTYGLVLLFKALIFLLVFLATPLFFAIVLIYERSIEKSF